MDYDLAIKLGQNETNYKTVAVGQENSTIVFQNLTTLYETITFIEIMLLLLIIIPVN